MARRLRVTSTSKSRGLSIMQQFLLCRERDGTWAMYAPRPSITADFPLLAFGKSAWNSASERWIRPDATDYADAERVLSLLQSQTKDSYLKGRDDEEQISAN
jgi:hypothetical protein